MSIAPPLGEVLHLRSKLKGHASGTEAAQIERTIRRRSRAYLPHLKDLYRRCDQAMRTLLQEFAEIVWLGHLCRSAP